MRYIVLHSIARMNRGGAETLIMNIFRNIDRTKYCFCFLLNSRDCDYSDEIERLGGKIYTIPSRSEGFLHYCRALDSFFSEHEGEFNAVHMHTSSLSSLEFLYYAKKHGIERRIIHSHNTVQAGLLHNILHRVHKPIMRFLATDYLACSKVAADWLFQHTGVRNRAVIIKNGIDLQEFRYSPMNREEIRKKHNICDDDIVIGHVGRFDVVKNHTFLIDVFDSFHRIHPNSKLVCVGIGGQMNEIRQKVLQKGLDDSIIFAGLQEEVYKYLSAFDYFVFPSLYEGLPVALVEAQASGLMTFCSDKVSTEVCISVYLTQLSLDVAPSDWALAISNCDIKDRTKFVSQIEDEGYNISKTVQLLSQNFYR